MYARLTVLERLFTRQISKMYMYDRWLLKSNYFHDIRTCYHSNVSDTKFLQLTILLFVDFKVSLDTSQCALMYINSLREDSPLSHSREGQRVSTRATRSGERSLVKRRQESECHFSRGFVGRMCVFQTCTCSQARYLIKKKNKRDVNSTTCT